MSIPWVIIDGDFVVDGVAYSRECIHGRTLQDLLANARNPEHRFTPHAECTLVAQDTGVYALLLQVIVQACGLLFDVHTQNGMYYPLRVYKNLTRAEVLVFVEALGRHKHNERHERAVWKHAPEAVQAFVDTCAAGDLAADVFTATIGRAEDARFRTLFQNLLKQRPEDVPAQACAEAILYEDTLTADQREHMLLQLVEMPGVRKQLNMRRLVGIAVRKANFDSLATLQDICDPWDTALEKIITGIFEVVRAA